MRPEHNKSAEIKSAITDHLDDADMGFVAMIHMIDGVPEPSVARFADESIDADTLPFAAFILSLAVDSYASELPRLRGDDELSDRSNADTDDVMFA